ncbi:MAG: hypothetical protein LC660_18680 [Desulfobacteraceae bacterium]|nr:hypothetical protein [Desulfobacteraceae bacterium]
MEKQTGLRNRSGEGDGGGEYVYMQLPLIIACDKVFFTDCRVKNKQLMKTFIHLIVFEKFFLRCVTLGLLHIVEKK